MQKYFSAHTHVLRKGAGSVVALALGLTLSLSALVPTVALAAAGEGSATIAVGTGGTSASDATFGSNSGSASVTVGRLSYLRLRITVGASHIAGGQNNITVQIPTNLFPTNGFTSVPEAALTNVNLSGEYFLSYTDTNPGVTNNAAISFAATSSVNTGLITIQANQQMDATDIITLTVGVQDLTHASNPTPVTIAIDDTGANSLVNIASLPLITTSVADAAATVTLGNNSFIGANGDTTLSLTLPYALDAADTIRMTFPAHINVANVASAVTGTLEATDSITCAVASQVVTCTTSAATNAFGTIIMTGITSSTVGSADMTSVEVKNEGNMSHNIASDLSVTLTNSTIASEEEVGTTERTYEIDVTVPEAGTMYMPGDIMDISWSTAESTGTAGFVSLYYSLDGGETLVAIETNTVNDGSYSWTIPTMTEGSVVVVAHATDLLDVLASDRSDTFSVNIEDASVVDEDEEMNEDTEETMDDGTFIRGESWTTVYYVHNGMRHPFLDSQTFFTYADDFSDVVTVSDDELANYTIGTPMLPMAGTVLVKIQSVNKVYALEAGNTLRWITSEALATSLYGSAWADYVIDVPVTAWGHFTMGEDIDSTADITVNTSLLQTRNALSAK